MRIQPRVSKCAIKAIFILILLIVTLRSSLSQADSLPDLSKLADIKEWQAFFNRTSTERLRLLATAQAEFGSWHWQWQIAALNTCYEHKAAQTNLLNQCQTYLKKARKGSPVLVREVAQSLFVDPKG